MPHEFEPRKSMGERVSVLEAHFQRFMADATSEKENRKTNTQELKDKVDALERRMRSLETKAAMAIGGLITIQFILTYFIITAKAAQAAHGG